MALQLYSAPAGPPHDIAGVALANSTTLTDISPGATTNPLYVSGLAPGTIVEVEAWGTLATAAAVSVLVGVYYGGVAGSALGASTSFAIASTTSVAWPWRIFYRGRVT